MRDASKVKCRQIWWSTPLEYCMQTKSRSFFRVYKGNKVWKPSFCNVLEFVLSGQEPAFGLTSVEYEIWVLGDFKYSSSTNEIACTSVPYLWCTATWRNINSLQRNVQGVYSVREVAPDQRFSVEVQTNLLVDDEYLKSPSMSTRVHGHAAAMLQNKLWETCTDLGHCSCMSRADLPGVPVLVSVH